MPRPAQVKRQTDQKFTVQEIHDDFNSVVGKIISDAELISSDYNFSAAVKKANRLTALGFNASQPVRSNSIEINNARFDVAEASIIKLQAEAAKYFSLKYPFNKFIPLYSVNKLCNKYGLKFDSVDRYIGDVPEKNLCEIENFKLFDEDTIASVTYRNNGGGYPWSTYHISLAEAKTLELTEPNEDGTKFLKHPKFSSGEHLSEQTWVTNLKIAAPESQMLKPNERVVDGRIVENLDPILLQPVFYEGLTETRIYLIVTAWGQEASDPMVVNERMN